MALAAHTQFIHKAYSEALCAAIIGGQYEIVRSLVKANADVNATHAKGFSPLVLAARYGHPHILTLLLEGRAEVDQRDSVGRTALMFAAAYGHDTCLSLLLQKGANLDIGDADGDTALMWACACGHQEAAEKLINWGASWDLLNNDGSTARDLAVLNDHVTIAQWLSAKTARQAHASRESSPGCGAPMPRPQIVWSASAPTAPAYAPVSQRLLIRIDTAFSCLENSPVSPRSDELEPPVLPSISELRR